jgi:hypothetical protein
MIGNVVLVLQSDQSIIRIPVCHYEKDTVSTRQTADRLLDQAAYIRDRTGTAEEGIKGSLANDQIKGFVRKR